MSKTRIEGPTAVIFDVGNTLYGWDPEAFIGRQLEDDEATLRFIDEVGLWDWHDSLDRGRPFADAAAELSGKFPHYAALISSWGERFGETIGDPVPGMQELVAELDERGVPLYALTNFSAEFWPAFRAKEAAFLRRFRGIVVSGEERLSKPDPALYFRALDRFGLKPAEALFVDDRLINVEGAAAVGMPVHLFVGAEDLRRRLEAEGLL